MRVETSMKSEFLRLKHSNLYGEGAKIAKLQILQTFILVIEYLLHNLGSCKISLIGLLVRGITF